MERWAGGRGYRGGDERKDREMVWWEEIQGTGDDTCQAGGMVDGWELLTWTQVLDSAHSRDAGARVAA